MATVHLTAEAKEQMAGLPKAMRGRIRDALKRLESWPAVSGVKRLTGNLAGSYRMRVSDYRLRFRVVDDAVKIEKIGHRKDVYED